MEPREKWERMNNPKCFEDYGLSISDDELRQFPAGRELLLSLSLKIRKQKKFEKKIAFAGTAAAKRISEIAGNVIIKSIEGVK